ncbi:hypothetical protein [Paenibacillus popilliae]|uniref:Molybdopterin converting factor n=1 Tax=Paenibacillus popilliae ATCC 14706 TaxID=1212764 RepID=M9LFT0_PAEPP|nr:hypothetical protein [Paenibacillus popilliae]GAC41210.1 molybdopterin converting factor [Paenibacillus popilliae ATCC 14706]
MRITKLLTSSLVIGLMAVVTQASFASNIKADHVQSTKTNKDSIICACGDDPKEITIVKNGVVVGEETEEYKELLKGCEKDIIAADKSLKALAKELGDGDLAKELKDLVKEKVIVDTRNNGGGQVTTINCPKTSKTCCVTIE